jgi:hypothetical protein
LLATSQDAIYKLMNEGSNACGGSMTWRAISARLSFEVTGSVSFESASGAANPALQPKPAGLAAVLYIAMAGGY